jgi:inhibitor of cysteine peptidase
MKRVLWILVLLLAACATVSDNSSSASLAVGEGDAGKTLTVAKGGEVMVTLAGNPTTGYAWALLTGNEAVLKSAGAPVYTAAAPPAGLVGSGGVFVFKFQAVAAGTVALEFVYQRPWEKDVVAAKTFSVRIRVE